MKMQKTGRIGTQKSGLKNAVDATISAKCYKNADSKETAQHLTIQQRKSFIGGADTTGCILNIWIGYLEEDIQNTEKQNIARILVTNWRETIVETKEKGYFVKGAWVVGIHPSMIGKKIVRTQKCVCQGGCGTYEDYTYSINGYFGPSDPEYEYGVLREINPDRSLIIEWKPRIFPGETSTLAPCWNDGNWIEYIPEAK